MKTSKLHALSILCACIIPVAGFSQIYTPSGVITGSSGNNSVGIGNVTLSPALSNKLVVSDAIPTGMGGLMKLACTNNQAGDQWWIGFSHGSNTTDDYDRARIGAEIIGGGAGKLFFTTGYQHAQDRQMQIDENGGVKIFKYASINTDPVSDRGLLINPSIPFIPGPTFSSGVGLEVNSPDAPNADAIPLFVKGGTNGILSMVKNGKGDATGAEIYVLDAINATGLSVNCMQATNRNIGIKIDGGGSSPSNTDTGYGLYASTRGAQSNIAVYGEATKGSPLKNSYAALFRGDTYGAIGGRIEGGLQVTENGSGYKTSPDAVNAQVTGLSSNSSVHGLNVTANTGQIVYGAELTAMRGGSQTYGLKSTASNGDGVNYGVYASASSTSSTTTNYGVYARISGGPQGTTTGAGSFAGYFSATLPSTGAGFFNGNVFRVGFDNFTSDQKFKKDIKTVNDALNKIMSMQPKSYTFRGKEEFPSFNFPTGKQYGFIAQELEKVMPELVKEGINPAQYDENGKKIADAVNFKSVQYTALIPVLVAAIQEQQADIATKDARIDELEQRIARLENQSAGQATGITTQATDNGNNMLFQNAPNPFNGSTEIRYAIPQSYSHAEITIFDMNGKQIKTMSISGREGAVTVSAADLSAGMYLYSLIIDGREQATKRMIVK